MCSLEQSYSEISCVAACQPADLAESAAESGRATVAEHAHLQDLLLAWKVDARIVVVDGQELLVGSVQHGPGLAQRSRACAPLMADHYTAAVGFPKQLICCYGCRS